MFTRTLTVAAVMAAFVSIIGGPAAALEGKDAFKGKTASWIVATAPGGGFDYYARLIARHMPKFVGAPGFSFVVVNRPGAGHTIGTNLIYTSKPDGMTIGSFTTNLVYAQVSQRRGIRFDLAKMSWIGKAAEDTRMLVVAAQSPYKTFADVINAKTPVRFAASGVGSGSYMEAYLVGAAFKIPQRVIPGFGNTDATLAMMRGELDAQMSNATESGSWAKSGQVRIIMQLGAETEIPGVANGMDFAKTAESKTIANLLISQAQLARVTAGPPAIPADRLKVLRDAYGAALASAELKAEAAKGDFPVVPLVGDAVRDKIKAALDQPPEVVELLKKLVSAKVAFLKHTGPITRLENGNRQMFLKHEGGEVWAKVSGSRTVVTLGGKKVKRTAVKVGMICTFTYVRPNSEAKNIDCK